MLNFQTPFLIDFWLSYFFSPPRIWRLSCFPLVFGAGLKCVVKVLSLLNVASHVDPDERLHIFDIDLLFADTIHACGSFIIIRNRWLLILFFLSSLLLVVLVIVYVGTI